MGRSAALRPLLGVSLGVVLVGSLILGVRTDVSGQEAEARLVVDGLEFPAGIAFTSDGRMLVTERAGRIRLVQDGELQDRPLAEIPVTTAGETGLLGIAVDAEDRQAYVFATEPDGSSNTIWRVSIADGDAERVITDLPAATYHNGGGVAFDDDGMLLVSNGEQHSTDRAQDPDQLGGKVYRFTPDGEIPGDNPFGDSPAFAIGLRNPFGLAVDPVSGTAWVTENGPESWDEINRVVAGGNHGWPVISGPLEEGVRGSGSFGPGDYQDPALAFEQVIVPTGIAFAGPGAAPTEEHALYFAAYGDATIRRAVLEPERSAIEDDEVFLQEGSPVVALAWGPEGLYYATQGGAVKAIDLTQRSTSSPSEEPSPLAPGSAGGTTTPEPGPQPQPGRPWWLVAVPVLLVLGYLGMRRKLLP